MPASDEARDLLVRGVAAAKANDKDEARFFLKWMLRLDVADPDQEAEAWLWLSQISDDPSEKRECLKKVLDIEPNHPLARRGMAILDGRLKPEDILDHRQPVQPAEAPQPAVVRRYICPRCGGKLAFNPYQRALACGYCGYKLSELDVVAGGTLEQDFVATLPTAKAHRWELPGSRALHCQGCGAIFALPPARVAGACPFCESPHVVETAETRELVQPEGLVPFQFDADVAAQYVRRWLADPSHPGDLGKKAALVPPRGVYLPYWTFDVGGDVKVYGPATPPVPGKAYTVLPGSGRPSPLETYPVFYNDLLVSASHSLPAELLGDLTDFDSTLLAPYAPDLLADWPAEIYQISMSDASLVARQRAFEETKKRIRISFGIMADAMAERFSSAGIAINAYKLVLLPVWVAGYRYNETSYLVLVNGQTGKLVGQMPHSGFQKLLAGLWGNI
jgi:ribosomal protein S27AE